MIVPGIGMVWGWTWSLGSCSVARRMRDEADVDGIGDVGVDERGLIRGPVGDDSKLLGTLGNVPAVGLDLGRGRAGDGQRVAMVEEASGGQREPVDVGLSARECDRTVRFFREGEDAHAVGAVGGDFEERRGSKPWSSLVLGHHEAFGRSDLQDRVHRRAEQAIGVDRGDERLPFLSGRVNSSTSPPCRAGH